MDEYIKEVGNNLEIDFLSDVGNGIFLSNREREILDRYNIDYKNKSSLKSILLEIEDILSEEEIGALLIFCREPKSRREMQEFMPKWSRTAFGDNVLKPLLASGRLLMTKPDSPKAPNQKYYANTEKLTT